LSIWAAAEGVRDFAIMLTSQVQRFLAGTFQAAQTHRLLKTMPGLVDAWR